MRGGLSRLIRRYWHFFVFAPLLIIVMTGPLVDVILDVATPRLPVESGDTYMKFWDAWYGTRMLAGQADFYFTDLLFHPLGLSLDFHNFSLPHMLVFGGLQAILPPVNAFALTHVLIMLANTAAAYLLTFHLFHDKWTALFGAVMFGLSPYVLQRPQHVEVIFVAVIPLAVYGFHRGVVERNWRWLGGVGALVGATVFVGMYNFVCLLLTLGITGLYLARNRWREGAFWRGIALFGVVVAAIGMLRVYPMIADSGRLNQALEKVVREYHTADLLDFFVNRGQALSDLLFLPHWAEAMHFVGDDAYLGYLPLLLIGFGLLRARKRVPMLPWLAALLFFVFLRLGDALEVGDQVHTDILLPRYWLADTFPWLFKAFWDTDHFQIGALLPLAILSCYGLDQIRRALSPRVWPAVAVILLLLACAERYQVPRVWWEDLTDQLDWIDWLAQEDSPEATALINLPMGRR